MEEEIEQDTSGFYKQDQNGEIFFGPSAVYNKDYTLLRDEKDSFTYPVDGWFWFNTREEAENYFK